MIISRELWDNIGTNCGENLIQYDRSYLSGNFCYGGDYTRDVILFCDYNNKIIKAYVKRLQQGKEVYLAFEKEVGEELNRQNL